LRPEAWVIRSRFTASPRSLRSSNSLRPFSRLFTRSLSDRGKSYSAVWESVAEARPNLLHPFAQLQLSLRVKLIISRIANQGYLGHAHRRLVFQRDAQVKRKVHLVLIAFNGQVH